MMKMLGLAPNVVEEKVFFMYICRIFKNNFSHAEKISKAIQYKNFSAMASYELVEVVHGFLACGSSGRTICFPVSDLSVNCNLDPSRISYCLVLPSLART
ncbi:uncharacterized protein A4U43_C07F14680 [Asparagus officinalis]|uniref:Uncharacterized protein n=2 Tax=Asparagus officinalis TaxID=4686 RepID=A0A5P1EBY8_ASPOF|nr:uncharacterized protein LOC109848525 isoform X2 [Asparagus officinalis]ONK63395.1 uncharacterized protein A4U43_C07F14680 [Asparagus officinalis]